MKETLLLFFVIDGATMHEMIPTAAPSAPLPLPSVDIKIRAGAMDDIPFLDSLQKLHTKQVGWMPTKQFEGKIKAGHVLIAVAATPASPIGASDGTGMGDAGVAPTKRVGYLIGNDQYFKRDDVGIIYQINVAPEYRRSLVAASLLKAQFERSAYGCKLYCCWCAQDIEANRFWEAMGFVPLAFRTGGKVKYEGRRMKDENGEGTTLSSFSLHTSSFATKARVHIFWQKRIRKDDTTTPWWFPSKTAGGSIREDRIVLPIPPGTHWSDAKPLILPNADCQLPNKARQVGESASRGKRPTTRRLADSPKPRGEEKPVIRRNGLMFDIPKQGEPLPEDLPKKVAKPKPEKINTPRVKRVCDPRLVAAARELRDRYLEHDHAQQIVPMAKYEVSRAIEAAPAEPMNLLDAA